MLFVQRAFAPLKSKLPASLSRPIGGVFKAILTPAYFALQTGHFRSALTSKAVDRSGEPVPWYTYPAIELLRAKSFAGKRVLEFGAGQSTIWWARQAEEIVSFEGNSAWCKYVRTRIRANASLHLVDWQLTDFEKLVPPDSRFDVIVIDGLDRLTAAAKSRNMLNPGGVFILDNAEGYWGPEGTYPIVNLFRNAGYARVDFYGFSPGNILPHCTSFFFRDKCFLFEDNDNPVRWVR